MILNALKNTNFRKLKKYPYEFLYTKMNFMCLVLKKGEGWAYMTLIDIKERVGGKENKSFI